MSDVEVIGRASEHHDVAAMIDKVDIRRRGRA